MTEARLFLWQQITSNPASALRYAVLRQNAPELGRRKYVQCGATPEIAKE